MTVELNGSTVDREDVRSWLLGKRCALWADWYVTDPRRMEPAIDWFIGEIAALAASMAPVSVPVKGKKAKTNGRSTSRSSS